MENYTTQNRVKEKMERMTADGELQISIVMIPENDDTTGAMTLTTTNPSVAEFFKTGSVLELSITPRLTS